MRSASKRWMRETAIDDESMEGSESDKEVSIGPGIGMGNGQDSEMGSESENELDSKSDWEAGRELDNEMSGERENEEEEVVAAVPNQVDNAAEMEELEKEYSKLRNQERNLLGSLTRHRDEDLLRGRAVKNQKILWDKTLELRFLLQKPFSTSNKLPQEAGRSQFQISDKEVDGAYSELITSCESTLKSMLELQEAIVEKNSSIAQATNETYGETSKSLDLLAGLDGEKDKAWLQIHKMHMRLAPFRNSSVDKWQRKTQVTTGAAAFKGKLNAFNQNISEQVATYIRDPSRMIHRMRLRRSEVGVIGEVSGMSGNFVEEGVNTDGDPELLDDSEFYQQLLKEFLESCEHSSSETAFYSLKKLQPKKRKVVDRRASKSRKIRYDVHEKIVNFMAPEPMAPPAVASILFDNLFGLQNK